MANTLMIVKHPVHDYAKWRAVYTEVQDLRDEYGVTAANVLQDPTDANSVTVLHWYPTLEAAQAFAGDSRLKDAMERAGISGPPRIEIVVEA